MRRPEPDILKFDLSSPQIALILAYCFLRLFLRINWHKETESEERTVHNTTIRDYLKFIMICNNLFEDVMKTFYCSEPDKNNF